MITLPTTEQIFEGLISDLEAQFDTTINEDGKTELRAQAASITAVMKQFYFALGALQENIWPDNCDEETLLRFGQTILNRAPFSATAGQYKIEVTGQTGQVIPVNSVFKSDDDSLSPGILYILDTAYTMPASTGEITVRALTLGEDGKLEVGDTLTATSPFPLISSNAEVTEEVVQPFAEETISDYRSKVLMRMRYNIFPGSATFYRLCGEDVQGIRRIYPYAKHGYAGQSDLYVEATVVDSTDGKGTPSQLLMDEYEQACETNPDTSLPINERGRRVMDAILNIRPITAMDVDIVVTGYQGLTAAIEADIEEALTEWLYGVRPFVAGADILADKRSIINNILLANVIGQAKPNSIFTSITFQVDGTPYTTYEFLLGNIPYLNTITFV